MQSAKKYVAEFIGTFVLTLFGCGSAALSGGINGTLGTLGIAFAFGLSIVAMAFAIGPISGCHINPAVSIAMLTTKRMSVKDFFGYIVSQCLGGIAAAGVLYFLVSEANVGPVNVVGLGADGFDRLSAVGLSCTGAIVVEIILTFVFVLVVLGVTSTDSTSHFAGIVIGLTLTFVHIMGIPLTGTSVNPARSLGPALLLGGLWLEQLWVFILAPLVGGILAAAVYMVLFDKEV